MAGSCNFIRTGVLIAVAGILLMMLPPLLCMDMVSHTALQPFSHSLAFDAVTEVCPCQSIALVSPNNGDVCAAKSIDICDCITAAMTLFNWNRDMASQYTICDPTFRREINPIPQTYPKCYMSVGTGVIFREDVICSCPLQCKLCAA